jgi:malonyl-CoA/methylmalonyl-CoA synthetase
MSNIYHYFKQNLLKKKKNILLTPRINYTFQAIDHFCIKLSQILSQLGMVPGDRLAVQVEKSEYNLFLYLTCLRSGFIYLPLNTSYCTEELTYFFQDAKPKVIVCDPEKEPIIRQISGANHCVIKTLDEDGAGSLLANINHVNSDVQLDVYPAKPHEIAVILYTSGTTGKPKGAMITHEGLLHNAQELNEMWELTDQDVILHLLPLFHVHGLFFAVHTALLRGASIILLPKFDVESFFHYLPQSSIFMGVPTYYTRLLNDNRLSRERCQHMRLFISGSAPLLATTFNEFYVKTGHKLLERYGMTETGINSSNPFLGARKVGTVGVPLPGVDIRIVNDKQLSVGWNEVGQIQIRGKHLFKGYWKNPDKTKEEFTDDGYFKTGDLGAWDREGYLSIVGRSKDLVITGGLNVYPKEIESTIDTIDGVLESAVIGVPHSDFGEAVVVVIAADKNKVKEQFILETLKRKHAGYKCPKKVFFTDFLPKNTMGKVQKNVLREHYSKVFC